MFIINEYFKNHDGVSVIKRVNKIDILKFNASWWTIYDFKIEKKYKKGELEWEFWKQ